MSTNSLCEGTTIIIIIIHLTNVFLWWHKKGQLLYSQVLSVIVYYNMRERTLHCKMHQHLNFYNIISFDGSKLWVLVIYFAQLFLKFQPNMSLSGGVILFLFKLSSIDLSLYISRTKGQLSQFKAKTLREYALQMLST